MKGTIIKAFRGYGFIRGEDGNTYHYKPVYEVGDQVEFEPSENEKGHEAINVRKEDNNVQRENSKADKEQSSTTI